MARKDQRDTVAAAMMVARIATGEIEDELPPAQREGGLAGGPARSESLTPEERSEIAQKAAQKRWHK